MPKIPIWFFILIAIVYLCAIGVDTMDVDASQYAEICREMLLSGQYLEVYDRGSDYLDKPPFLFWSGTISMKLLGVNNLAFKLPSILFALLALYSTYRLAKLFYSENTARTAALVLATCQGMFLMTNDIRCDTILMSWTITAIWLIQEWIINRKFYFFVLGCMAAAFGMMTKGPIAIMVPIFCFISDWALKRQWNNFLKYEYIIGIIIIAILLIPMSFGLYQQFDSHPEKTVNGLTNVSGLRFFFWSQSFGRITGESPWNNNANMGYLLQNMLWSFIPWIIIFLPALFINIKSLIQQKLKLNSQQEWITSGGFILSYLALGTSSYQLPHYIFVVFPLAAIITAKAIEGITETVYDPRFNKVIKKSITFICGLFYVVVLILITYVFPSNITFITAWSVGLIIWIYVAFIKNDVSKLIYAPATALITANVFLALHVYPSLLEYQFGSEMGRHLQNNRINVEEVATYKMDDPLVSIHFYAKDLVKNIDNLNQLGDKSYIITSENGLTELKNKNPQFKILKQGEHYRVTRLKLKFLNPKTRDQTTQKYYFVKLN